MRDGGKALSLPFGDGSFDVVVCSEGFSQDHAVPHGCGPGVLQAVEDLAVPGGHSTGRGQNPLGMVVAFDVLKDRQPNDLVHGVSLALGLPAQQRGLLVGHPECHRHGGSIPR